MSPKNRFEIRQVVLEPEVARDDSGLPILGPSLLDGGRRVDTRFIPDVSKSIVSRNDSPDVGFDRSINPYRGCEHGCSYCYARPTHEYLGYSAGLDFETRIMVKHNAPSLLKQALSSPSWEPRVLGLSGVTDAYQPIERKLEITRRCLEVLAECRQPVAVITKNHLVTRDIDYLGELARHRAAAVFISITTLSADLARVLEPRASSPKRRLEALSALSAAGIPCGVMVAPVIPAINDHEIPAILEASAAAGAMRAGTVLLRLPYSLKEQFEAWLHEHFPLRATRVLSRMRQMRGGQLNETRFGSRMLGEGPLARQTHQLFEKACARNGLNVGRIETSGDSFRPPRGPQMGLFEV